MKFFDIDGKKHILNKVEEKDGTTTLKLVPVSKEYYKIIEEIAKIIVKSKTIVVKDWIKEAMAGVELSELKKMHKELKKGTKPKAKKGCYGIDIGKHNLELVG